MFIFLNLLYESTDSTFYIFVGDFSTFPFVDLPREVVVGFDFEFSNFFQTISKFKCASSIQHLWANLCKEYRILIVLLAVQIIENS